MEHVFAKNTKDIYQRECVVTTAVIRKRFCVMDTVRNVYDILEYLQIEKSALRTIADPIKFGI